MTWQPIKPETKPPEENIYCARPTECRHFEHSGFERRYSGHEPCYCNKYNLVSNNQKPDDIKCKNKDCKDPR